MKRYKFKRETLESYIVISNENETKNIATFKNGEGRRKCIRIQRDIKMAFDQAKKEDKSQQNQFDKYIEHIQLDENTLYKRTFYKEPSLEDKLIEKDRVATIIREIWKLPAPQNRRVYMFVVDRFTYSQVARIEKVHRSVAKRSIDVGIEKLRKNLKKLYNFKNF